MSALLPCPFCGGLEGLSVDGRAAHYVYCNGCDAAGPVGTSDQSKDAAIAAWNSRATPAEVETLRARVERQSRIMATLLQHAASAPLTDNDMAWARAQVAALEDRT